MNDLATVISYIVPILSAIGIAAKAALTWPHIPWVLFAFFVGLWLPRQVHHAPPAVIGQAIGIGVIAFLVGAVAASALGIL